MKTHSLSLILLAVFVVAVNTSKILVVAPMPSYSHFSIPFTLAKELALRGHEVTCINAYPLRTPVKNYTDVRVVENIALMEDEKRKLFSRENRGILDNLTSLFDLITKVTNHTLAHKNVQKLLNSGKEFDVVIVEQFFNEVFVGFGYHFNAPVILISATGSNAINNYIFANPAPMSYVPGSGGSLTKHMNFWERIENVLMNSVFSALVQFYHLPQQRKLFSTYISSEIDLDTILFNTSLMLANSHVSVSDAVPHVPNIIEIGGFHINHKGLLPELQSYLDSAEEGVILFSMGSNLRSEDLKPEVREGILRAFSNIKQQVLWKFETELPNLPDNVEIMPWLPQQDILAHPNVRAFITHGGFLSTLEAVYHGVPIIGIPVFGDQKSNVASAVKNGYAIGIPLEDLSETTLSQALDEILTNDKYKKNVQQRSKLMHDQPLKPIDSAVYWVEHVIRHKGAPHLRSAGLDLQWYQREMVDIIVFLIVAVFLLLLIVWISLKKICQFLFHKKVKKVKKTKKDQ